MSNCSALLRPSGMVDFRQVVHGLRVTVNSLRPSGTVDWWSALILFASQFSRPDGTRHSSPSLQAVNDLPKFKCPYRTKGLNGNIYD